MSIMVGTGKGAGLGVPIKNAEALEVMGKVDTLVVDKTGALTEGKPQLIGVEAAQGFHEDDLLRIAASRSAPANTFWLRPWCAAKRQKESP